MLSGDLDVVLVRKLRAPGNPEFAIGSIDESGWTYLADYAGQFVHDPQYIEVEKAAQLKTMQARRKQYTPIRPPFDPKNRIVIVIDDGLATGSTMIAALHALKAKHPKTNLCCTRRTTRYLRKIKPYADEIVCLNSPRDFYAVGQFYQDFPQVSDEEVIQSLKLSRH